MFYGSTFCVILETIKFVHIKTMINRKSFTMKILYYAYQIMMKYVARHKFFYQLKTSLRLFGIIKTYECV